jgi:hypothetical protein
MLSRSGAPSSSVSTPTGESLARVAGANARAFYGLETEVGKVAEQSEVG